MTAYYYLTCGSCRWCKADRETLCENLTGNVGRDVDGGYAEFIKLPANSFIKLPEVSIIRPIQRKLAWSLTLSRHR